MDIATSMQVDEVAVAETGLFTIFFDKLSMMNESHV